MKKPTARKYIQHENYAKLLALIEEITTLADSLCKASCRRRAANIPPLPRRTRAGEMPCERMSLAQWPTTSAHRATCGTTSLGSSGVRRSAASRVISSTRVSELGHASAHILRMELQPGKWDHRSPRAARHPNGQGCLSLPPNLPVVVRALHTERTIAD